jgi:PLP dependent protein
MNLKKYKEIQIQLKNNYQSTTLIAVTKYSSAEEINIAIQQGIKFIGENKLQDAEQKFPLLLPVQKHFIGTLQTKKIRKVIELFDVIQSVGSYKHLEKINSIGKEKDKKVKIFLQINISSESQKSGFKPSELEHIEKNMNHMKNLSIQGIMGIAEKTENEIDLRMQFRLANNILKTIQKIIPNMKYLSLGMSSDYKIALEEGANMVRIGKSLFQ